MTIENNPPSIYPNNINQDYPISQPENEYQSDNNPPSGIYPNNINQDSNPISQPENEYQSDNNPPSGIYPNNINQDSNPISLNLKMNIKVIIIHLQEFINNINQDSNPISQPENEYQSDNNPPSGIYPNNINQDSNPISQPENDSQPQNDFQSEYVVELNFQQPETISAYEKIICCPPKIYHGNGLRRSWTAGTFLIDGSHLNKARICASRINNTIFGPIHGKPVFVKNNLNIYGRYAGFPGGSGTPIRNKF